MIDGKGRIYDCVEALFKKELKENQNPGAFQHHLDLVSSGTVCFQPFKCYFIYFSVLYLIVLVLFEVFQKLATHMNIHREKKIWLKQNKYKIDSKYR